MPELAKLVALFILLGGVLAVTQAGRIGDAFGVHPAPPASQGGGITAAGGAGRFPSSAESSPGVAANSGALAKGGSGPESILSNPPASPPGSSVQSAPLGLHFVSVNLESPYPVDIPIPLGDLFPGESSAGGVLKDVEVFEAPRGVSITAGVVPAPSQEEGGAEVPENAAFLRIDPATIKDAAPFTIKLKPLLTNGNPENAVDVQINPFFGKLEVLQAADCDSANSMARARLEALYSENLRNAEVTGLKGGGRLVFAIAPQAKADEFTGEQPAGDQPAPDVPAEFAYQVEDALSSLKCASDGVVPTVFDARLGADGVLSVSASNFNPDANELGA